MALSESERNELDQMTPPQIADMLARWHSPEIDDYLNLKRIDFASSGALARSYAVRCVPK